MVVAVSVVVMVVVVMLVSDFLPGVAESLFRCSEIEMGAAGFEPATSRV
jgi:hypothetical protein